MHSTSVSVYLKCGRNHLWETEIWSKSDSWWFFHASMSLPHAIYRTRIIQQCAPDMGH